MAEAAKKLPVANESRESTSATAREWHPFTNLRREIDRLFDDFQTCSWRMPAMESMYDIEPFWRGELSFGKLPAVDIVEKEKAYDVTVELPGMSESDIKITLSGGMLTIAGEKKSEREEKSETRRLSERRFGSMSRSFRLPEGVEADKIEARFKDGVFSITIPKSGGAQAQKKTIPIKG